jgi:hypothetical protein
MELKRADIVSSLFTSSDVHARLGTLVTLVLDLLMEVEALREALMRLEAGTHAADRSDGCESTCRGLIQLCGKSAYGRAYLDTAYLTHNNAGPSGGLDKLLAKFYPLGSDEAGRTWRESLLLDRLGFSEPEIAEYMKAAEEAEMFT